MEKELRANAENAEIFFGDKINIQNTCNYMKGYAPNGKTPVVRTEAQKFKINMLSAVSKRGKLRFVLYKDNMDSDKLIDFMRRLVHDSTKKVCYVKCEDFTNEMVESIHMNRMDKFREKYRFVDVLLILQSFSYERPYK